MTDFRSVTGDMIRRSRALLSLVQSVQGTLDTVDLLYDSDEDVNEHQAIAQHLWSKVLPEIEPGLLEPGEGFEVVLIDGKLADYPHSWIALKVTDTELHPDSFQIIIDTYCPGTIPQILLIHPESPIMKYYVEEARYRAGEAPE